MPAPHQRHATRCPIAVLEGEDNEVPEQHDEDGKEAHIGGSRGFAPAANDDEANGSGTVVINLTSDMND